VSGSDVYAGGYFTTAGGVPANSIAKWNGSNWSALGPGMNGVNALAVAGGDVYAASGNHIAKWNGSSWSALGSVGGVTPPYSAYVSALAVSGSDLYAGGVFTTAGGVSATNIAKWDGSSWSALGLGIQDGTPLNQGSYVYALAVLGSDLYAGGAFTTAGGVPANYIAKWNGSNWSAVGSGMNNNVYALAVSGSNVYAGGTFIWPTFYIAKWDGSSWSDLGSWIGGVPPPGWGSTVVYALAVSGSDLYAGGDFTMAGGKVSAYAAHAVLGDAPGYNRLSGALANGGTMQFSYIGYPATNYALDRTFNLSPPISWDGQQTNTMSISGVLTFTNTPTPGTNNFWRVRSVP